MSWEAVSALASLASAGIVAVAAIAALVQIRHLRAGVQVEAVLRIYDTFNDAKMVEARRFVLNDFVAPLPTTEPIRGSDVDARVLLVANFQNEIGAMVADGFIDERLVWPLVPVTALLWERLAPLAAALRSARSDPIWADFQYVATLRETITPEKYLSRYPASFQRRLRAELAALKPAESIAPAVSETRPA